jgi:hypothetical protein
MRFVSTVVIGALISWSAIGQIARPGDDRVVDLIESAQDSVSEFARSLDKDLRRATLRNATAEVNVQNYLGQL